MDEFEAKVRKGHMVRQAGKCICMDAQKPDRWILIQRGSIYLLRSTIVARATVCDEK